MSLIHGDESFAIIGRCFEVYNELGPGFLEIVYKDALELELKKSEIPYKREHRFDVRYKGNILEHYFVADFVVFEHIILEIKSKSEITENCYAQALNYLKVSGKRLAIIINFGERKLNSKRIVH